MTSRHPTPRRLLAAAPVVACLFLAACGSDDDEAESTTTVAAAATTAAPSTTAATTTEAPDTTEATDTTEAPDTTEATDTPEATDTTEMTDTTEASDTTTGMADGDAVEVVGSDYAFGGIPETVAPGTKFTFTNASDVELHEMVVVKVPEGEDRPVDELVQLPESELEAIFGQGPPAFVQLAFPGSDEPIMAVGDGTVTEEGRYVVVCFIPEGTDPEAYMEAAQQSGDGPPPADPNAGPPHVALGMYAEFTVEG